MSLSKIMSEMGLSVYAEVALVIFILVFVLMLVRILRPGAKKYYQRIAQIPLNDDEAVEPRNRGERHE